MVFRPTWVRYQGIKCLANNCFLIKGSDGIDPIFVQLREILVIGGNLVTLVALDCRVLYFDDHFHSYVIEITPNKLIITMDNLYDPNVYHTQYWWFLSCEFKVLFYVIIIIISMINIH